jgi:signal transduction histidine kinase
VRHASSVNELLVAAGHATLDGPGGGRHTPVGFLLETEHSDLNAEGVMHHAHDETRVRNTSEETEHLRTRLAEAQQMAACWKRRCTRLRRRRRQQRGQLTVLAGGLAHEFNNLFTVLLGYANLLLADLPPGAGARAMVRQMEAAVLRGAGLVRQVLAAAGQCTPQRRPVDLSAVVGEALPVLGALVGPDITLTVDLDEGLPVIQGDAGLLGQALIQLTRNAAEALGRRGAISVRTTRVRGGGRTELPWQADVLAEGEYAVLEVADDGPGIAPEHQARLFEPFATPRPLGRGLGLPAVLGIARAHGGTVRLVSRPGQGSVFQVLLPCG